LQSAIIVYINTPKKTEEKLTKDSWDMVSCDDIKKAFTCKASNSSWNSIRRYNIDPNTIDENNYLRKI
jgi:hypothetical protein